MLATKTLLMVPAILVCLSSTAQTANRFDLVITEIMADPAPVVGLPNAEYLEIKNISSIAHNLNGWRLSDASSTAIINTTFILQPDSAVILCANSNAAAFALFGRAIGVSSFPSLDNDGDLLTLRSPQNRMIHAVRYAADWYGNEVKREGGWSLEMIDPKNPCTGKGNWKASVSANGGTPGHLNSVNGINIDAAPPHVKRAYAPDNVTLIIVFDEPLDSASAASAPNYSLPGLTVASAVPLAPLFQSVQLKLTSPLQGGNVHTITISNVADCKGNTIGAYNKVRVGLAQATAGNDIIINEILFNPRPGAHDYVEFYNRSNKIIDASLLYIANRSSSGTISFVRKLSEEAHYLFPGDYVVATENKESLQKEYLVKNTDAVLSFSQLPSYPDDKGTVVLLTHTGAIVDEVAYDKKWHFALLSNSEGVSLERLHPEAISQDAASWHSAASTAGYGTPTYLNSQYNKTDLLQATVAVSPAVFSPDNDGRDDLATIQYAVEQNGYVANVFIFDAGGRMARHLVKNELLALKGAWRWNGLGEMQNKLPIGTYIIYTEIFDTEGKKKSFKETIVLARSLN